MLATPAITAIVITIFATLSFGGGFVVSDWRSSKEMQRLSSENAVLRAANDKCATDVVTVRAGVKEVTDALDAKKQAADAAMKDAQYSAGKHSTLAEEVNSLPVRPDETQCQAVEREQREYVQAALSHDACAGAGLVMLEPFSVAALPHEHGAFQASRISAEVISF
ncbi:hypothetical protein SAMN05216315_13253 [Nitrosospira sp. Nsp18]|uniref:hypothetical protein n=1 Tax=Nitrosospira sp. Nsp18 TaxID=1855334 RepID=UPI0008877A3F|nr:hypothetical protein [Nitrosospira sp. Nsp18]SDA27264.1 hypothetical protein SAMN05216315_13253 [Nitrosospira sp. Nsp18]